MKLLDFVGCMGLFKACPNRQCWRAVLHQSAFGSLLSSAGVRRD